ncbi:MAG: lactate utilization protein [Desulfuromonadales bacterium]|nr:MAG: lactate utilization protein [Desulfuromonadales bacterium]
MVGQFATAAEAVGATVKRFTTLSEAITSLRELVSGRSVAASSLPDSVHSLIAPLHFASRNMLDQAEVGISFAQAGIAATGSVLLELSAPTERSATALPPVHVVLLRASTIVPNLAALRDTLQAALSANGGRYLSLITGPSRTADIERVLTIGVHGPKELYLLIIEGE